MTTKKRPPTEFPPITEEHKKRAKKMMEAYDDQRPTTTLPGSGGTVSGTAVNDWVDDEGKPIYGREDEKQ